MRVRDQQLYPGRMSGAVRWWPVALAAAVLVAMGAVPAAGAPPATPAVSRQVAAGGPTFAWGDNSAGELGDGTLTAASAPVAARGLTGERAVALGGRHALALLSNGTVLTWGDDTFGQLGNGIASSNGDTETPMAVPGLSGVTAVAAGEEHSLALLSNGTVMAWGDNAEGQLGDGTLKSSAVPVPVNGLTGVMAVAAGGLFSLALLNNGTVMAWGQGQNGQLGDGTLNGSAAPVPVKGLTGVTGIAAGERHALALLSNGTAMSWGSNDSDQLGDGKDLSTQPLSSVPVQVVNLRGVRAIAAGAGHSVALLAGGAVMSWGDNGFFQLARPNGFPGGISNSDVPLNIPGVTGATAIAAGGLFSLAVVAGGKVMAWGDNALGQLGDGSTATGPGVVAVKGLSGMTAVTAGGVAAMATGPAATGPAAVTVPVSSPWRVTASPLDPGAVAGLVDDVFNGVSAASATDAWAVGASDALANSQPLAEHWDGHAWHTAIVPLPTGATTGQLSGVRVISPGNVWAVGSAPAASNTQRTLIEHWDGTRWSVIPSPNPATGASGFDSLSAIGGTSATDLWAVGFFGSSATNFDAMLFEHWDGTKWSFVPPPTIGGFMFAKAVIAISSTDAWAVGDQGLGGTVSAHWDGKAWSLVPTPTLNDGTAPTNTLTGVTATGPDNVWASGYEGNVNQQNFAKPYVLHWNGTSWSLITVPNSGTEGSLLRGIAALSATDIWAAGQTQETDGALLSLTEHFNGTSWSLVPSLDPGELPPVPDSVFAAITSAPPATLFAVGTQELPARCCLLALAEQTTHG